MNQSQEKRAPLAPDKKKLQMIEKATAIDQMILKAMTNRSGLGVTLAKIKRQFLSYYFTAPPVWKIRRRAKQKTPRMAPDFFSLGAVRSGTTSLSEYIMQHPCVVLPLAKEIGLRQTPMLRAVLAQFPSLKERDEVVRRHGMGITGLCAPVVPTLAFPYYAPHISAKAKIVIIMRDPVDRAFAHWRWDHEMLGGLKRDPMWATYPDFSEVARIEVDAARSGAASGLATLSGAGCGGYLQHSIYHPFIKLFFETYDRERFLFINSSDYFADPVTTAKRVYAFLGLPDYEPVVMPVKNAGAKTKMDEDTRQLLRDYFEPLNRQLYELIGEDFGW